VRILLKSLPPPAYFKTVARA